MLGIACLWISSKIVEPWEKWGVKGSSSEQRLLDAIMVRCRAGYTRKEICEMELEVLACLDYYVGKVRHCGLTLEDSRVPPVTPSLRIPTTA